MNIIIGNIISLIATIIMVIGGLIKDSKKFVVFQTTQILISVVANLFLLSPSGAISNLAGATSLKILTIATVILWTIFDFSILNFVAGTFDVITIITCLIILKNIKKAIDKNQKTCYNINTD